MNVLAVGMDVALADAVRDALEPMGDVQLVWASGFAEARAVLRGEGVALVVAPPELGGRPALELVESSIVPMVVVGPDDAASAASALEDGALDYVVDAAVLPHVVRSVARERAQAERAQVAEERLLHANRLIGVGRLAAVTAHEVGTPLNVARMQAQLIAADAADPRIVASCDTIVEQIDVASRRMRAMLDFARLGERGKGPINLAEAVHSAAALLKPVVVRQGVELVVEGPDLVVVANRSQVQQVVFNLVSNALHALDGPGRIHVAISAVSRGERPYGRVQVADDGPGVPEAMRDQLFDAFVTSKPAGRGTGLGLAVCRDIAEAHGGWIDVTSSHEGTRVEVAFPT